MRFRRALWLALAVAVASLALVLGLVAWELSPGSLKPRLIEAAERATGRTMTIAGPAGIELSLTPTIWMEDVTLSNPPGLSRPEFVKIARVELTVGLMPLLRHQVEIERIALLHPDILLETGPGGHPNWVFTRELPKPSIVPPVAPRVAETPPPVHEPPPGEEARSGPPIPPGLGAAPLGLAKARFVTTIRDAIIVDGRGGGIDPRAGQLFAATLQRVGMTAPDGGPAQVAGTVMYNGRTIGLAAHTGSLRNLLEASAAAPWPVSVKAQSHGVTILAEGKIASPLRGRGYDLSVDGEAPDPPSLVSWLPGIAPHSLKAVTVHAEVSDGGGRSPVISALQVKVGSIDLDNLVHGAQLGDVRVSGAGSEPLKVSARLTLAGFESGIAGTIGDLAWLSNGRSGPLAIDLEWNAASARGTVTGTIREPRRLADYALTVALDVPNPALVMDGSPPALRSVALRTTLTDAPGPIRFALTSNAGDLTGELSISRSPRLSVAGTIASRRLDLDMLRGPPAAEPPAPGSPKAPAPPAAAPSAEPLIPSTVLPLDQIRAIDADVKFSFGRVRLGGADIAGIGAALRIQDGMLRLDPVVIASPEQHLNAALIVDATATPPLMHLTIAAPALPLQTLLAALGLPPVATGTAELHGDLVASGDTLTALGASLDGWAGLAVDGGQLDARLVDSWLAMLRPLRIDAANATALKCFALRADAKSGVVTIDPLVLNTEALIVEASGDIDLAHETLALRVRPRAKIGGTGIALPVRVSGPLRAPSARIDISGKGFGGGALAGLLLGGKDVMGAAGGGDPCGPALARAREGAPAPDGKP